MNHEKPYRPCVVGVLINDSNLVLVAERSDTHTWQFPQGGVEEGESSEQALHREMMEEIGCNDIDIIRKAPSKLHYDFPKGFKIKLAKHFRGQEQTWFLCSFKKGAGPDLTKSTDNEFVQTKWVSPEEAYKIIVDWKKPTYREGLSLLGLIKTE